MKKLLIITGLLSGLSSASVPGQNLVTNGDFEAGSNLTFDGTPNWFNRGTAGQAGSARGDNLNLLGSDFNAVISDRYNFGTSTFGPVAHSQRVTAGSYKIQGGDFFSLSYDWRDASGWEQAHDQVRFVLFATVNDTLAGTVVWSETLDSGTSSAAATWESVSQTTGTVTLAAVGKDLFIQFYGVDLNSEGISTTTGFARVDNISVSAIPEPSTYALLGGLAALAFVTVRRRRS
jgi:hypothetical protein